MGTLNPAASLSHPRTGNQPGVQQHQLEKAGIDFSRNAELARLQDSCPTHQFVQHAYQHATMCDAPLTHLLLMRIQGNHCPVLVGVKPNVQPFGIALPADTNQVSEWGSFPSISSVLPPALNPLFMPGILCGSRQSSALPPQQFEPASNLVSPRNEQVCPQPQPQGNQQAAPHRQPAGIVFLEEKTVAAQEYCSDPSGFSTFGAMTPMSG
jgi:hypothetical protein